MAYSKRELTYGKDRLAALAGVAQIAQKGNGLEYLAGMWNGDWLHAFICWQSLDARPQPPYRAPSWSWAAVDGGVHMGSLVSFGYIQDVGNRIFSHVLHASVTTLQGDPFGQIIKGVIKLCCSHLVAGKLNTHGGTLGSFRIGCSSHAAQITMDYSRPKDLSCTDAVLLPLSTDHCLTYCLALEATGARGEYRRIGFCESHGLRWYLNAEPKSVYDAGDIIFNFLHGHNEPRDLFEELYAEIPRLACEERSDEYPGEPYVITII